MKRDDTLDRLAARARDGDRDAFGLLVRRLLRPALATAWEFVPTREDAEDITQDAFARVWRQIARYDAARPFAPWFFTILRNVARNARHCDRRWQHVTLTDGIMAGELHAVEEPQGIDADDVARIHDAVESLPPMQRACLRLTELEGFTSGEVGAMLGMSDATVRVHAHRARKALRARLGAERTTEP